MPISFEQPSPVGGANFFAGYAGGGGGGGHQNPFPPIIPAPHVFVQPVMPGGHEDPVDAQLRLDEGRLSMAEELRLQRLQNGLADVDQLEQDGTLSNANANDLRVQIRTGIDPLARRRAQASLEQQTAQTRLVQNQAAQAEALRLQNQRVNALTLQERMRIEYDPQLMEQASREYDDLYPEGSMYAGATDDVLSPEQRNLRDLRQQAIESQVRAMGGAFQMFLDNDGQWKPLQQGARGGQIAGEAGAARGAGTGTGTTGTRGGGGGGLTAQQILAERNKAREDARTDMQAAGFNPLEALGWTPDMPAQDRERVVAQVRTALGGQSQLDAFMQLPVDQGAARLRELMKEKPSLRAFIESRMIENRMRENMTALGLGPNGQPQRQDWRQRFAPPGQLPAAQQTPAVDMSQVTFNNGVPDYSALPQTVQTELTVLDRLRDRIALRPASERERLYGALHVARTLYQNGLQTTAQRKQFDEAMATLRGVPAPPERAARQETPGLFNVGGQARVIGGAISDAYANAYGNVNE